jgi:hypothetical protein
MALEGLREALADSSKACQETTLATAIALSSYRIISGDVSAWRIHLGGARDIILHRHQTGNLHPVHNTITAFLLKWFAHLYVIAGASGHTHKKHNYDSAVSLIEEVIETNLPNRSSEFDTFTGFTSHLFPLLLRIGKLAQQEYVATQKGSDDY